MRVNEYHEVVNAPETYEQIAEVLFERKRPVFIGWTDDLSTHFDILFVYQAEAALGQILNGTIIDDDLFLSGSFQGGVRPTDLFVSIMRWGCFAFDVDRLDTEWGYYEEKLGQRAKFGKETGEKLAELINGVKAAIVELKKKKK